MHKIFTLFLIFAIKIATAQTLADTIPRAHAYINGYHVINSYFFTGKGHTIGIGYINHYSPEGKALPVEIVRIDFTNGQFSKKTIPEFLSGVDVFWISLIDTKGNIYLSGNVPQRKILRLNLEDSIYYTDMGNAFEKGTALGYSMLEGQDGKIYFGGSSGGTFWSSYDPTTKVWDKRPVIDSNHVYVLSITGDAQYMYAQTGQQNAIRLWAIRKKDGQKKLLASIVNTTRFNVATYQEGIYVSFYSDTLKGTFILKNGAMLRIQSVPPGNNAMSYESRHSKELQQISSVYEPVSNELYFGWKNLKDKKIKIPSAESESNIRKIFSFPGDTKCFYYVGDYYGNYYQYEIAKREPLLLGNTGLNVYSFLALNDSIMYMGGYPSGYLMVWNRHQPWTVNRFINGKFISIGDKEANPKLLIHWKSEGNPPAGFHHTLQMIFDKKGNIIGAGNVIRIGNAASVGVFNPKDKTLYGIDYSFLNNTTFSGMIAWKDKIIFSVKGAGKNYLWFYDPQKNRMTDSIDVGFDDYGKLYLNKNLLTGIANDRIYMYDLAKNKLIKNFTFPKNSISNSFETKDGKMFIHSNQVLPPGLTGFYLLPYNEMIEIDGTIYAVSGKNIYKINEHALK